MAGRIRITGMNSGLDTDSMVRELVNAYEKQGEKYTKAKTKTEWKQEAWTISQCQEFYIPVQLYQPLSQD